MRAPMPQDRPIHRLYIQDDGERRAKAFAPLCFSKRRNLMRYRVYVGSRGSEAISPLQKDQFLFKEFSSLDEAFGWARHVNGSGRVTLLIDGDDGTSFSRNEIAAALHHPDSVDHAA